MFCQCPQRWQESGVPDIEEIRREWNAQLDKLTALGLNITYGDTHMFPELFSDELFSEMKKWYWQKGLLDHRNYYHLLPDMGNIPRLRENSWNELAQGQYFLLTHPSDPGETESRLYGNAEVSGDEVRTQREDEYRFLTDPQIKRKWQQAGIESITYREARPLGQKEGDARWPE